MAGYQRHPDKKSLVYRMHWVTVHIEVTPNLFVLFCLLAGASKRKERYLILNIIIFLTSKRKLDIHDYYTGINQFWEWISCTH